MAALKNHQNLLFLSPFRFQHPFSSSTPSKSILRIQNLHPAPHSNLLLVQFTKKARVPRSSIGFLVNRRSRPIRCLCHQTQANAEDVVVESERPPFDINLAVLLAGFAFEAYNSPPESVGKREIDAANCQTVFLSSSLVREVYDGQLFIKLKKGFELPALDPWGTSDPYVVLQFDGQVVKSNVKWATREPIWNEEFTINIKIPPKKNLQVAAWDANLVTPHKRMGNAAVDLESFCDGNTHELLVALGGMGGGGKIHLEVTYKSFDDIDKEKQWWRIPLVSELLAKNVFASALKKVLGSDSVQASEFVQFAFGQLRSLNSMYLEKNRLLNGVTNNVENSGISLNPDGDFSELPSPQESRSKGFADSLSNEEDKNLPKFDSSNDIADDENGNLVETAVEESMESEAYFWKNLADVINQSVMQKLGLSVPEKIKWDGFESLKNMSSLARKIADAQYVESGLAAPKVKDVDDASDDLTSAINGLQSSLPEIKKASLDLLKQTDAILGALMVLTATFSQQKKESDAMEQSGSKSDTSLLDQKNAEEMRELFSTAESAMEAWAMLATSLGRPSCIKSEFEKICFLDNPSTDTQVAVWRDTLRKRLVVAFRGTEQARWKDLRTDLMLVPTGLNPERIGGDFKELQVHSGFLSAYDSVKNRLMSLIKVSIGFKDDSSEIMTKWHVYVTGHSLGGALATLLALELSSSQMAKHGAISITMYNFGSPRVGNKRFAEVYNEKVKDSWRVVNHRDIIPTVPRLMGYCHVAQPVYLAAGELEDALENMELLADGYEGDVIGEYTPDVHVHNYGLNQENMELLADGYEGDVIGEYTPDVLVSEFMKGERELVEKILQTEINIFCSIRDGTALMQHMEDFYYITLLESVRSSYQTVGNSTADKDAPLIM